MRITEDNIAKYLDEDGDLDLRDNKKITHIDYLPENIKYINIGYSNIVEITCELPEGLEEFYCNGSKISTIPLLPKSLEWFGGRYSKLPKEFHVYIDGNNIQCNNLRKLQMIDSL